MHSNILDKYIHSKKYLLIFSWANLFGYSFVIFLSCQIYSDIHSSNIYGNKYIPIFIRPKNLYSSHTGAYYTMLTTLPPPCRAHAHRPLPPWVVQISPPSWSSWSPRWVGQVERWGGCRRARCEEGRRAGWQKGSRAGGRGGNMRGGGLCQQDVFR